MATTRPTVADKRARFRALHEAGCFVMPNPWDVGSALILQSLGFEALASTSAGMAWAHGQADNAVTLDLALNHLTTLAAAVDLPLNADFENGFADAPEAVAANVTRAVETGIAGLSIEDSTGDAAEPLYDFDLAVARIAAARAAIDASGSGVVLTARSEGFLVGRPDLDETVRRLRAYGDAGADCLYAPLLREPEQFATVVAAVAPKPVNALNVGRPVAEMAALGVRRISIGGTMARAAYGALMRGARAIIESGSFAELASEATSADFDGLFADTGRS